MKTIAIKIFELCDEIDYWKKIADYYKEEYEKTNKAYNDLLSDSIHQNNIMMRNVIKLILSKEQKDDSKT